MERTGIFALMGELKLYGMRAAYDEVMAAGIKRQHKPPRIVGDLLKARLLAAAPVKDPEKPNGAKPEQPRVLPRPCPCCGGRMIVIEVFARGYEPRYRPPIIPAIGLDSS